MTVKEHLHKNRILEGLPLSEQELILPACHLVDMNLGDEIEEAGRAIRFLHFPISSAISVTNLQSQGHMVEVTVTGKEGCAGASIILGNDRSPCMAIVQIGGVAIRIPTSDLFKQESRMPYLRAALGRYNLLMLNLAVISVGCSQFHGPTQRIARWLKTHWHRTGIESFPFSDAFLAAQAGIEPKTASEVLKDFQKQGIVQRKGNIVTIVNHDAMEKACCTCYALAKESTEEYLRDLAGLAETHKES